MAEKAQALGQYARYDSVLPQHLSELAILVTARTWSSGFEWTHHAPIAQQAGVPPEAVLAIGRGERVAIADPQMAAVFAYAVELHRDRMVGDSTHAAALEALGEQGVVCGDLRLLRVHFHVDQRVRGAGRGRPEAAEGRAAGCGDVPLTW